MAGLYTRMGFSLVRIEDSTKLTIRITFRQRGNWQVGQEAIVVVVDGSISVKRSFFQAVMGKFSEEGAKARLP